MKTAHDIKKTLAKYKPILNERFKVRKIGIFGSYIHGTKTRTSDIDILVDLYGPIGWEFIDLKEFLEKSLGMKVDLVTIKALKPQLRDAILREVVYT